jgi:hypothetical protein
MGCCDDPANFRHIPNLERDLDSGAFLEDWYQCESCGNRIGAYDYEQLSIWTEARIAAEESDLIIAEWRRHQKEAA